MKKRDAYHHGDLRHDLVEAVRQLVESDGPDRFTIADACRIAGVSTAAPYRHFADKDEMLRAVALDGMSRHREAMEAALAGHAPGGEDAIHAIGMAYLRSAEAEPGVFRLMFGLTRAHADDAELKAEGMRTYGVLLNQIAIRLGKAQVDDEVLDRSFPLWTFVHGLSFLLIDHKVSALKLKVDIPTMLRDALRRLLAD